MVWVDDLIVWVHSQHELVVKLSDVLDRLHDVGLFVAAHKCRFFEPTVKWCAKMYSGQHVEHDLERLRGLTEISRPQSVGDLMKFLQASSWMRLHLPRYAAVQTPAGNSTSKAGGGAAESHRGGLDGRPAGSLGGHV